MSQLNSLQWMLSLHNCSFHDREFETALPFRRKPCLILGYQDQIRRLQGLRSLRANAESVDSVERRSVALKDRIDNDEEQNGYFHVKTLRRFPKEELVGKVVMVRFDSNSLLSNANSSMVERTTFTIKYLYHAGAKVVVASDWNRLSDSMQVLSTKTVADHLSLLLQLKVVPTNWVSDCTNSRIEVFAEADILLCENLAMFKEERGNCSEFAGMLSSGIDIFVNDCFSQSHKVLASTVGVPCYCYASVAGFHFEEKLGEVMDATMPNKQPYVAIIGGGNLFDKAAAVYHLTSKCDGVVFVGMMAFQIMHAIGLSVPLNFVESRALEDSLKITHLAYERGIPLLLPKDFYCVNDLLPQKVGIFPAHEIKHGWTPVDLGPISLNEISSFLSRSKKILWIGPVKFKESRVNAEGALKLAMMLEAFSQNGRDVTVVGSSACQAVMGISSSINCSLYENASVMWRFLKGMTLPGHAALDRAYPCEIDWHAIFGNPSQPLLVDIGSGNGLFLFKMAARHKDKNFLGLEINKKLVQRCLYSAGHYGLKNRHFIATNATSTFRSIVSSYPGELVLVSIQCPNPDFNKPEHRWRMLQRSLIEAIADLLKTGGKVFLQSDVEAVAVRMREQILMYGKGNLAILEDDFKVDSGGWLEENPFGSRSDWEQHVIDRGAPMYRLMILKIK
ncbi:hypothetical protein Scep_005089 [Stephania cephalantha]|uniref:Phosphoglycerate kinase n=1 Tax=Stephania cephalantha TaxID=152367 RepID=A0AAP0PX66_9MAGN